MDRALSAPAFRGAHVGFLAVDATSGRVLVARDADDEFVPASNFKLLTGSAALWQLGSAFRFVTTLSADAPASNGVIAGNLYLRGGGDAALRVNDLDAAAHAISSTGVRSVSGALITDASHDDAARYAPGWSWDDLPYDYSAVVSALELEEGTVHVYVSPGATPGAPVTLRVVPRSNVFTIENGALTGAAGSSDTTDVARPWDQARTIRIIGSYPAGAAESSDLAPAVPDPTAYAGDVVLQALDAQGIAVTGGARSGITPATATLLWRHESAAMPQLLAAFWLPSDNLMGELFLKELGAARSGEPGDYTKGIGAEQEYLRAIGVNPATVSIWDGSGLSVYDRITPRDLVQILQSDWNGSQRQAVIDALPEAGLRGTLKDSFAGTPLQNKLFAKTGSEKHTRALSGFLQTPGGTVTFSLLINGWLGDDTPAGRADLARAEAALLGSFFSDR